MFESIKAEKRLSLNHWRYRILHWAFNVECTNPKEVGQTGIPMFLYTNYCPLFHLTNLIALLSPIILFIKINVVILTAFAAVIGAILDYIQIGEWIGKLKSYLPEAKLKPEPVEPNSLKVQRKYWIRHLSINIGISFTACWASVTFDTLEEAEAHKIYDEYMPKLVDAYERARKRKEQWRSRIIFWTNFSRVFIKWAMNLLYIGIALALAYAIYLFAGSTLSVFLGFIDFIIWIFTDAVSLSFFFFMGKLLMFSGVILTFLVLIFRLRLIQRFFDALGRGIKTVTAPLYIVFIPFRWIYNGFSAVYDFVAMFYEENCPPVILVSDEEAIVESVANGEEENV